MAFHGITITDRTSNNLLAIDLINILQLFEIEVKTSWWEVTELECLGAGADELYRLVETNQNIPGQIFFDLATRLLQVIDGKFVGYREDKDKPWIVISAVDSSAFDVFSENENVLNKIRQNFREVNDLSDIDVTNL